ncbi:MAG: AMP-binding protein, partial [Thermodesulfobacteriota bacterium]
MRSFTLYDMFHRNGRIAGKADALVWDSKRMSFAELLNQVNGLSGGLAGEGIGKGDRLAILAHNDHRFFLLFGAAAALGAVVVPINWRLSDDEIVYILKDSGAKALVVDEKHADRIRQPAFRDLPEVAVFPMADGEEGAVSIDSLLSADPRPPVSMEEQDPFCLIYTAAVEGKPRGAVLTHGNMIYGNLQTIATMGLTPKDAYINMLPIFHITGLNLSFSVMHAGGKNVVIDKFDEKRVVEETAKEKVSVWGSFPPMLARLTEAADAAPGAVSSLRHV